MNYSLLQWNCRGFRSNFEELSLLCTKVKPSIIALQETFLQESSNVFLSGFNVEHLGSTSNRPHGGVATFIRKDILFSSVQLDTPLTAVAVRVSLHKCITICNIYLSPSERICRSDVVHLIEQLPSPFLLMGDFNGHAPLWGDDHYNSRGQMLEDLFSMLNLCVLNDGSYTYCHPATGKQSVTDLTVCHPSLVLDFSWQVHEDLCGSDHHPVLVSTASNEEDDPVRRWNLKKADWPGFSVECKKLLTENNVFGSQCPISFFTSTLVSIAEKHIPQTSTVQRGPRVPWFNDCCKIAHRERKKAQRRAFRNPSTCNILEFKRLRAKARSVFKKEKKTSWKKFCSSLSSKTPTQKVWKAIRKIKGKGGTASVGHLSDGSMLFTDKKSVSNLLASTIAQNSSVNNYSEEFQREKVKREEKHLDFSSDNSESYNLPFTIWGGRWCRGLACLEISASRLSACHRCDSRGWWFEALSVQKISLSYVAPYRVDRRGFSPGTPASSPLQK